MKPDEKVSLIDKLYHENIVQIIFLLPIISQHIFKSSERVCRRISCKLTDVYRYSKHMFTPVNNEKCQIEIVQNLRTTLNIKVFEEIKSKQNI